MAPRLRKSDRGRKGYPVSRRGTVLQGNLQGWTNGFSQEVAEAISPWRPSSMAISSGCPPGHESRRRSLNISSVSKWQAAMAFNLSASFLYTYTLSPQYEQMVTAPMMAAWLTFLTVRQDKAFRIPYLWVPMSPVAPVCRHECEFTHSCSTQAEAQCKDGSPSIGPAGLIQALLTGPCLCAQVCQCLQHRYWGPPHLSPVFSRHVGIPSDSDPCPLDCVALWIFKSQLVGMAHNPSF